MQVHDTQAYDPRLLKTERSEGRDSKEKELFSLPASAVQQKGEGSAPDAREAVESEQKRQQAQSNGVAQENGPLTDIRQQRPQEAPAPNIKTKQADAAESQPVSEQKPVEEISEQQPTETKAENIAAEKAPKAQQGDVEQVIPQQKTVLQTAQQQGTAEEVTRTGTIAANQGVSMVRPLTATPATNDAQPTERVMQPAERLLAGSTTGVAQGGQRESATGGNEFANQRDGQDEARQPVQTIDNRMSTEARPAAFTVENAQQSSQPDTLLRTEQVSSIMRQIERMRESGRSWMNIELPLPDGRSLKMQLRIADDRVQVRVQEQSEEVQDSLHRGWSGLSRTADQQGIQLDRPIFGALEDQPETLS